MDVDIKLLRWQALLQSQQCHFPKEYQIRRGEGRVCHGKTDSVILEGNLRLKKKKGTTDVNFEFRVLI